MKISKSAVFVIVMLSTFAGGGALAQTSEFIIGGDWVKHPPILDTIEFLPVSGFDSVRTIGFDRVFLNTNADDPEVGIEIMSRAASTVNGCMQALADTGADAGEVQRNILIRNGYRRVLPRELVQKRSTRTTGEIPAPVDPLDLRVYPNPFNPVTTIRFRLPEAENVRVQVFTLQGREIARPLDEWRTAGTHSLMFEAGPSLPNGVYLVTVKAGSLRAMKRVTVLR